MITELIQNRLDGLYRELYNLSLAEEKGQECKERRDLVEEEIRKFEHSLAPDALCTPPSSPNNPALEGLGCLSEDALILDTCWP